MEALVNGRSRRHRGSGKYLRWVVHDGLSRAEHAVMNGPLRSHHVPFVGGRAGDKLPLRQNVRRMLQDPRSLPSRQFRRVNRTQQIVRQRIATQHPYSQLFGGPIVGLATYATSVT